MADMTAERDPVPQRDPVSREAPGGVTRKRFLQAAAVAVAGGALMGTARKLESAGTTVPLLDLGGWDEMHPLDLAEITRSRLGWFIDPDGQQVYGLALRESRSGYSPDSVVPAIRVTGSGSLRERQDMAVALVPSLPVENLDSKDMVFGQISVPEALGIYSHLPPGVKALVKVKQKQGGGDQDYILAALSVNSRGKLQVWTFNRYIDGKSNSHLLWGLTDGTLFYGDSDILFTKEEVLARTGKGGIIPIPPTPSPELTATPDLSEGHLNSSVQCYFDSNGKKAGILVLGTVSKFEVTGEENGYYKIEYYRADGTKSPAPVYINKVEAKGKVYFGKQQASSQPRPAESTTLEGGKAFTGNGSLGRFKPEYLGIWGVFTNKVAYRPFEEGRYWANVQLIDSKSILEGGVVVGAKVVLNCGGKTMAGLITNGTKLQTLGPNPIEDVAGGLTEMLKIPWIGDGTVVQVFVEPGDFQRWQSGSTDLVRIVLFRATNTSW